MSDAEKGDHAVTKPMPTGHAAGNGKLQWLALSVAVASLLLSTWNFVETRRYENPFKASYAPLEDSLPPGQQLDKAIDVGEDENNRSLFYTTGSCVSSCGTTYCQDAAYVSTGTLSVSSDCYPYSAWSNYLAGTVVPQVKSEHEDWGLRAWRDEGFSAVCESTVLDFEIYNFDGTYGCVTSVDYAVATQLACAGYTGSGSCSGGGGSGGGVVGGGGSFNVMCTPYCMCLNRIKIGGSATSSCSHYELTSNVSPAECGCS